jgi:hypothetical protein
VVLSVFGRISARRRLEQLPEVALGHPLANVVGVARVSTTRRRVIAWLKTLPSKA